MHGSLDSSYCSCNAEDGESVKPGGMAMDCRWECRLLVTFLSWRWEMGVDELVYTGTGQLETGVVEIGRQELP